jgi:LexA-binding, inner membrane-associated putative hydrolase
MLVAHIPAGYLIAKLIQKTGHFVAKGTFVATLIGAVIPDIDMIWFWIVDNRQHHHHGYFSHWPSFWLIVFLVGLAISFLISKQTWIVAIIMFFVGTMSHMVLDSVAAPIMWLAPLSYQWFELSHVPASAHGATYALLTHWTFGLELAICLCAVAVFYREGRLSVSLTRPDQTLEENQ